MTDAVCAELMTETVAAFDGFEIRDGENLWEAMIRTVNEMVMTVEMTNEEAAAYEASRA